MTKRVLKDAFFHKIYLYTNSLAVNIILSVSELDIKNSPLYLSQLFF